MSVTEISVPLLPSAPSVQLELATELVFIQKNSRKQDKLSLLSFFEEADLAAGSRSCNDASADTGLDIDIMTEETGFSAMLVEKGSLVPPLSLNLVCLILFLLLCVCSRRLLKEHRHQEGKVPAFRKSSTSS